MYKYAESESAEVPCAQALQFANFTKNFPRGKCACPKGKCDFLWRASQNLQRFFSRKRSIMADKDGGKLVEIFPII